VDLEDQDAAALLPGGTDPTVISGYRAQLKLMAKAVRSNNTAWIQFPLRGAESSYIFDIHPLSRGSVTIDPSNPYGEPLVDYRSLSNPIDLRVMVELFKAVRNYFKREGAIQILSPVEISPGPNVTSDEEIANYLAASFGPSAYHPVGTCAKMPKDMGGVVDEYLRVHGIRGLSVADASIMPLVVGATTQSTVYAIAEKVYIPPVAVV
jgi:choline dehydrogenase